VRGALEVHVRAWLAVVPLLAACGPTHLQSSDQVDAFLSRSDFESACVGLKSEKDSLREYTATKLLEFPTSPVAAACLCEAIYDADKGAFDPAVTRAAAGSRRDDLAECLLPAVTDDRIDDEDLMGLVGGLARILSPAAAEALATVATGSAPVEVRAAAVAGLAPSKAHVGKLGEILGSGTDATIRAAAAGALEGRTDAGAIGVLKKAASDDDASVRLAAVTALGAAKKELPVRDLLCKKMIDDPDPGVRAQAITLFKGTNNRHEVRCLRKRLETREEDASVRTAALEAMKTSPHEESSKALCELMGPYVRMYVKDKPYDTVGGAEIYEAQNHNHWEASYDCVQRALKQGGYSCWAKNYLALSFRELGGSAHAPTCGGG
jgi:HEAT repeat protein